MNVNDYSRPITAEDLIRRYKLDSLNKDRKIISDLNKTLIKRYNLIEDFVTCLTIYRNQAQKIVAWFLNDILELPIYDTNDVNICYDRTTGLVYKLDNELILIEDSNLTEVLAIANSEVDTSDNKRIIFYSNPSPPYNIGDVWLDNGVIKRCRQQNQGEFKSTDWVSKENYSEEYAKYNNDLNEIKNSMNTLEKSVGDLTEKIEVEAPINGVFKFKNELDKVVAVTIEKGLIVKIEEVVEESTV